MLVKSCRKLKIGSLCSCFSSQKPPSRVNRLQTQGFPQRPTAPSGRSHFCSGGAVCLPGLPSPLPLAFSFSISALWLVVFGHPSPATPPPFFPFLLLLFLFYSLIFGHPQRKDETAGGKGAEGGPGFPKPGFCRHPWVRVFKLLGGSQARCRHPISCASRDWQWPLAPRGDGRHSADLSSPVCDLTEQVINNLGLKILRLFLKWLVLAVINTPRSLLRR